MIILFAAGETISEDAEEPSLNNDAGTAIIASATSAATAFILLVVVGSTFILCIAIWRWKIKILNNAPTTMR